MQVTESVVLPSYEKGGHTMQIPLPTPCCAHFQTTELPCLQCGKQMNLALVEPSGPKFELRTYKCIPCDIDESFLMVR
jgi:hypothetical protein